MSIRQGTKVLAGSPNVHLNIFDWKWADHTLNDVQWLRADTFSWQAGSVYEAAYNELFNDIYKNTKWHDSNYVNVYTNTPTPEVGDTVYSDSDCTISVGTVTSYDSVNNQIEYNGTTWDYNGNGFLPNAPETVAGYTVYVFTGRSGRKIVGSNQETDVANIYNATGVAWYYILDIPNKRFKLPRTKFGFTGLRDTVGNYVAPGLPNITGSVDYTIGTNDTATGAFTKDADSNSAWWSGATNVARASKFHLDASRSSSIYGASTTVQPPATQMYLYFYVGDFTQNAIQNTAGITAETLNDKLDLDGGNATSGTKNAMIHWCMPDYSNAVSINTNYTATKDGWVIASIVSTWGSSTTGGVVYIDGLLVASNTRTEGNSGKGHRNTFVVPIAKGSVVTFTSVESIKFAPCIGEA